MVTTYTLLTNNVDTRDPIESNNLGCGTGHDHNQQVALRIFANQTRLR